MDRGSVFRGVANIRSGRLTPHLGRVRRFPTRGYPYSCPPSIRNRRPDQFPASLWQRGDVRRARNDSLSRASCFRCCPDGRPVIPRRAESDSYQTCVNYDPRAHLRRPIVMMRQG